MSPRPRTRSSFHPSRAVRRTASGGSQTARPEVGEEEGPDQVEVVADPFLGIVDEDRHGERKEAAGATGRHSLLPTAEMGRQGNARAPARGPVLLGFRPGQVVFAQQEPSDDVRRFAAAERIDLGATVRPVDDPLERTKELPRRSGGRRRVEEVLERLGPGRGVRDQVVERREIPPIGADADRAERGAAAREVLLVRPPQRALRKGAVALAGQIARELVELRKGNDRHFPSGTPIHVRRER